MDSSLACSPEVSHLSVGSISLVLFASLVAVYIIGGFLYQRLIVGAKAMEQFPHLAFWQDLGNLVADGCDFVCRSKPGNVRLIVESGMTSWGKNRKKGMIICYQWDCTFNV